MYKLDFKIEEQPDNTSCGPVCLKAVYEYYHTNVELTDLVNDIHQFEEGGGTLAVMLAKHALSMGFKTKMYSYNLNLFDPTWFKLSHTELIAKLNERKTIKNYDKKYVTTTDAYIEYINFGGELHFKDLKRGMITKYLKNNIPILTGLSSTWLYQMVREDPVTNIDSDIEGEPAGHFVVLYGYDEDKDEVLIADPYISNPIRGQHYYSVPMNRLITSILLGVMTYDGNLLIIHPKEIP